MQEEQLFAKVKTTLIRTVSVPEVSEQSGGCTRHRGRLATGKNIMNYFFILGNNPTLSIAEISAVFGLNKKNNKFKFWLQNNIFIMETNKKIEAPALIKKIGGTIKIGIIDAEINLLNQPKIINGLQQIINTKDKQGKFKFGISYYGKNEFNTKKLGMEIKKYLREQNISCRWVTSKEKTLSSVVVEQNKLTDKGIEAVLFKQDNKIIIGHTLAVQPFKELSFRDYGRPARDDLSGMLPPKLAQIMINLSAVRTRQGAFILDPFCGSGTILTEAMLMGYKNLIGSDISEKAICNTKKNIQWLKSKYLISDIQYQLFNKSTSELSNFLKPNYIDAIITEPYLGPQRGKININKIIPELEKLYSQALTEFKKILKPGGKIVIVWPTFRITHNAERITPEFNDFKIVNPIPKNLRDNPDIKLSDRDTIIYGRQGQRVWREIVVLEKN